MPLPLAPIAAVALRAGVAALTTYAIGRALQRQVRPGRTDQRAEDVLDDTEEGIALHRPKDRPQANAAARFRRVIRWGGAALEIDAAALFRLRLRRV